MAAGTSESSYLILLVDGRVFWNLKAHPQWHTSTNKATSPNPSQTVTPTGDQVFKHELMGAILIQTDTAIPLVLGTKPRTLNLLGKFSTMKLNFESQSLKYLHIHMPVLCEWEGQNGMWGSRLRNSLISLSCTHCEHLLSFYFLT